MHWLSKKGFPSRKRRVEEVSNVSSPMTHKQKVTLNVTIVARKVT